MTAQTSLSAFIRQNIEPITEEWENFAVTLSPAADNMTHKALRDHIREILSFIANDIESAQSGKEQRDKSRGSDNSHNVHTIGSIHGGLRFGDGFDVIQMVSEYRALRASIVNLWKKNHSLPNSLDLDDLTRFNESIDQLLAESLRRFVERLDYSRDLILGVIGHDIRNPLGAIKMSAELVPLAGALNEKQVLLTSQIVGSSLRINQIITDLLDMTRARIGTELPIHRATMDMGIIAAQIVAEIRAQHPNSEILLETTGGAIGEWDNIRLGQVLSNLIGNAVQYSPAGSMISVIMKASHQDVILSVHNEGPPIPKEIIGTIFDLLVRARGTDTAQNVGDSLNMGLGLFIVKQIVLAHGGEINVTSTERLGTTFTARFPKIPAKKQVLHADIVQCLTPSAL